VIVVDFTSTSVLAVAAIRRVSSSSVAITAGCPADCIANRRAFEAA